MVIQVHMYPHRCLPHQVCLMTIVEVEDPLPSLRRDRVPVFEPGKYHRVREDQFMRFHGLVSQTDQDLPVRI